jgi:hypothetical protein
LYDQFKSLYAYAWTISKIFLKIGLQEVLPTKNPSISLNLIKFSVLVSVTGPPYNTLTSFETYSPQFSEIQVLIISTAS